MPRALISALLLICALNGAPASAAKKGHARPSGQTIIIYTGIVDAKSGERFSRLISSSTDKIIGLKITVAKSTDEDNRFYSSLSENQLNITTGDPMDGPVEVLINQGVGTTTAGEFYTADGFYLVKSGGSHGAGAVSFGTVAVSEATIRLNPRIRLVSKSF